MTLPLLPPYGIPTERICFIRNTLLRLYKAYVHLKETQEIITYEGIAQAVSISDATLKTLESAIKNSRISFLESAITLPPHHWFHPNIEVVEKEFGDIIEVASLLFRSGDTDNPSLAVLAVQHTLTHSSEKQRIVQELRKDFPDLPTKKLQKIATEAINELKLFEQAKKQFEEQQKRIEAKITTIQSDPSVGAKL
jgi:hypothetical protein